MTKLEKLLSIRLRAIGDIDHHVEKLAAFTEESSPTAISFRLIALEKAYKDFADVNAKLERLSSFHEYNDLAAILTSNRVTQDKYITAKLHANDICPQEEATLNASFFPPPIPQTYNEQNEVGTGNQYTINRSGIKLPHIALTPFDGRYEKWPDFKDMFLSLMKSYKGDNVEKLTHLKNFLRISRYQLYNI